MYELVRIGPLIVDDIEGGLEHTFIEMRRSAFGIVSECLP